MQNLIAKCALVLAVAFFAPASQAYGASPDALLRAVSDEVIGQLKGDRGFPDVDPLKISELVHTRILPLFDFERMTQLAVARSWHAATPEQRDQITAEFRTLLVRTYSAALQRYRGEPVVFKELRAVPQGKEVTVRSEVRQPGNKRMTLDYELASSAAGWKIYNVKFADVCLVSTYRDLFAEKIRHGGVDGLISFLVNENRGSSRFDTIKASVWEQSKVIYAIMRDVLRSGVR